MKTYLYITLLMLLASCKSESNNTKADSAKNDSLSLKKGSAENDSTIQKDTLKINNEKIVMTSFNNEFQFITKISGDTIIKSADDYHDIEFLDIDKDGYLDIRVFILSKMPNQCDNYLYNNITKTYMLVKNCDLDIQKIGNSKFFYSYNSTGCSDNNWESYICLINNWTQINIGFIDVKGCGSKEDGISIYKVNGSSKKLITKLPIIKFEKNRASKKWDFIKDYWDKNHKLFE